MSFIPDRKSLLTYLGNIAIMAAVALLFCSPVLQGKRLVQDDIVKNIAQSHETREYRDAMNDEPLWTTRVFSGMTTFHMSTIFVTNVTGHLDSVIHKWLPRTVNVLFVTMLGFYILLLALGVNPWLALAASLTYGLSTNLTVSLVAGHVTKVMSIAYMAPAIGGVILAFRNKRFIGSLLALLFVSLMINSNHYQIMYYFFLISMVAGIVYGIYAIKDKTLPDFLKSTGILLIAGLIALLPNAGKMYNAYSHSDDTIRGGKSELSTKKEGDKGGLDKSYAMAWSYGPLETMTLVVPSFMGGASGEALPEGGNVEEALQGFQLNKRQKEGILAQAPMYIGEQRFILGTVYFGAGFIFLFIMSIFFVKGRTRVWLLSIIAMSLIISWGRHADIITGFLFDYFPMYNKFRTPSMALAIAGISIPLMGILGLQRVLSGEVDKAEFKKAFRLTLYISGGLMVLLLLYGLANDWIGPKDSQYQGQNSPWGIDAIYDALLADRKSRYIQDWFISTLVMAVTAFLIWSYERGKMALTSAIAILSVAFLADMWHVSKRYLNNEDFVTERDFEKQFNPTPSDNAILQDNDPHYRVINVTKNPWTDGMTCYHHENVGGHHAAKLQRYQDLIENALSNQLQKLNNVLVQQGERIMVNPAAAMQIPVYNMLNTKYFIVQSNAPNGVALNGAACGNAWFVEEVRAVESADAEMAALENFDPNVMAIVGEGFESLADGNYGKSGNSKIELTEFEPNHLKYVSNNSQDGLAVFSEIYYENGWNAWVDGEPVDIHRVNYVLRAIEVPAGEHTIEMKFEPSSFQTGKNISLAGSILFLLFAGGLVWMGRKKDEEG